MTSPPPSNERLAANTGPDLSLATALEVPSLRHLSAKGRELANLPDGEHGKASREGRRGGENKGAKQRDFEPKLLRELGLVAQKLIISAVPPLLGVACREGGQ